jgi:isoleucyl-tRNA synthetase
VNRVQNLRKSADFDVTDRIAIQVGGSESVKSAIEAHKAWIRNETLASEFEFASQRPAGAVVQDFEIGTEIVAIGLSRTSGGSSEG